MGPFYGYGAQPPHLAPWSTREAGRGGGAPPARSFSLGGHSSGVPGFVGTSGGSGGSWGRVWSGDSRRGWGVGGVRGGAGIDGNITGNVAGNVASNARTAEGGGRGGVSDALGGGGADVDSVGTGHYSLSFMGAPRMAYSGSGLEPDLSGWRRRTQRPRELVGAGDSGGGSAGDDRPGDSVVREKEDDRAPSLDGGRGGSTPSASAPRYRPHARGESEKALSGGGGGDDGGRGGGEEEGERKGDKQERDDGRDEDKESICEENETVDNRGFSSEASSSRSAQSERSLRRREAGEQYDDNVERDEQWSGAAARADGDSRARGGGSGVRVGGRRSRRTSRRRRTGMGVSKTEPFLLDFSNSGGEEDRRARRERQQQQQQQQQQHHMLCGAGYWRNDGLPGRAGGGEGIGFRASGGEIVGGGGGSGGGSGKVFRLVQREFGGDPDGKGTLRLGPRGFR